MKRILLVCLSAAMLLLSACSVRLPSLPGREASTDAVVTVETPAPQVQEVVPVNQEAKEILRDRLFDMRQNIQPGTAGSSLRAAAQAAQLLDWAVTTPLSSEEITEVVQENLPALAALDLPVSFAEQVDSLAYAIQLLTSGDETQARALLADCGMENSAYPWTDRAVLLAETVILVGATETEAQSNEPTAATPAGWYQDNVGRYFYNRNGSAVKNDWVQSDGKWYYMGANGAMVADRFREIDGKTYYFNADGTMASSQWVQFSDSIWYYFGADGARLQDQWLQLGSTWYYLSANGAMLTGQHTIDGKVYSFEASGAMLSSKWVQTGNEWYYYGASGARYEKQWLEYNGNWYYFDSDGTMLNSTALTIGDKIYAFNENGVCLNP